MHSRVSAVDGEVFAQAPCRADLAGATLDLWPLYLFHEGAVTLNFALSIGASCRITPAAGNAIHLKSIDTAREERFASLDELMAATSYQHLLAAKLVRWFQPEGGFALETKSESPAGAGIAGSSALMIATTSALARYTGRELGKEETRVLAQNVEAQIINVPTGCQDYYPALYGGANAVHLEPQGIRREGLPIAAEDIEARFVIVYTGAPRQSGINNWEVFKLHIDGDQRVVRNFEQISQIAQAMHRSLLNGDWNETGRLMTEEWKLRKSNHPHISTPFIDKLANTAARNGGRAAKVCGAGGGGCVVFMTEEGAKGRVEMALTAAGATLLPFTVNRDGLKITTAVPAIART